MSLYVIGALCGMAAGLLAGLCGVGGGIVLVPAFVFFLRMDQKTAVATSLAVIIVTSLAGTLRNSGNQLVDWKVVGATALASAVMVWFASDWLRKLSNLSLTRLFAIFMVVMGIYMLVRSFSPQADKAAPLPVATSIPPVK
jgi:uncharacterized membrane protein YfcA